jgi:hypothetical protein
VELGLEVAHSASEGLRQIPQRTPLLMGFDALGVLDDRRPEDRSHLWAVRDGALPQFHYLLYAAVAYITPTD